MTFPRALREAIPAEPAIRMRVLNLSTIDAEAANTFRGPRIRLRLVAEESGKLTGQFPVLMDLSGAAARQLATSLLELAKRAEELEQGPGW